MKEAVRGDRVKFLNEEGSGVVTRVIDSDLVMVRTDDGFEYPVMRRELIVSAGEMIVEEERSSGRADDSSRARESKTEAVKEEDSIPLDTATITGQVNILLAVVPLIPDEPVGGDADIFLVNDSSYFIYYHCAIRISGKMSMTISAGRLEPETKVLLGTWHLDDLFGKSKGIIVNALPHGYGKQEIKPVYSLEMNPERSYMSARSTYTENDFTEGDAFAEPLYPVVSEPGKDIGAMLAQSLAGGGLKKDSVEKPVIKPVEKPIEEVDLHIEMIIDDTGGMGAGEMFRLQVDRFRTSLEGAIRARQKKIVYIHGTGEGKLKHEIRRIIDREYPDCRYQDASFREYGYGATMVIIK